MDWYPWYYTIYESDTMHLNPYQDGCYRRLIDHYMKTRQALPDNEAALSRIIGDSEANWVAMASAIIRPFFTAKNGRLYHKKCELTLAEQDRRSKKLSESGKNGAKKRWNPIKEIDSHPIGEANSHPIATPKPNDSTLHYTTGQEVSKNPPKPPKGGGRRRQETEHPDFSWWYDAYPHKVGRAAAVRAFDGAVKKAPPTELFKGMERYVASKPADRPWCNPATWLNQERWKDEPDDSGKKPPTPTQAKTQEENAKMLERFADV